MSLVAGAADEPQSLWSTLREAVRGTSADFTKIPIGRAVLLLAVPMVLEMCMESVFAVADIFFVGHLGLTDAISTVGFTESLMTIIKAQVPMSEMLTYEQHLTSATGGRGSYHMEYSHYDEVPSHLQTKIIAAAKAERAGVEVEEV